MSLVGPRPEVVGKLKNIAQEEKKTLELRPGITDWASIWNADKAVCSPMHPSRMLFMKK